MQNDSDSSSEEVLLELEAVIGDVHSFLNGFCERLQCLSEDGPRTQQPNSEEADSLSELQEDWELKRASVEERLRNQVDMLADAWLRLEAEQRSFMQLKHSQRNDSTNDSASESGSQVISSERRSLPGTSEGLAQPRQLAVHEFERLRQEIQSCRPQRNLR